MIHEILTPNLDSFWIIILDMLIILKYFYFMKSFI